jgi:predicted ATP-binding protein involved in virulence
MRIETLHLTNFRGFNDVNITLPKSNVIVFIGINGSGKSSILDSIAILLSNAISRFVINKGSRLLAIEDDIQAEAMQLSVRMQISYRVNTHKVLNDWLLERSRSGKNARMFSGFTEYIDKIEQQLRENSTASIPFFVYYSANRLIRNIPTKTRSDPRIYTFIQFYAYEDAFTDSGFNYEDFLNWFRAEEDIENEIISRLDSQYINLRLQTVRTALEIFLSDLNTSNFSDLRIVRERRDASYSFRPNITNSLEINKDGIALKIEQLSEGEKNLVMIVCDIARRLVIANPALDDPKTGCGIVLIDEIDNHLHPQWQRQILPALTTTFPNCQFITTTHSPQVLSNLKPEEIFVLEKGKISNNFAHSYGRDSNSILYEFMGVEKRPEWMRKQLDLAFHLIDEGNIDGAKKAIGELKQFLGQNDPDIVRANTLLQFLYE